MNKILYKTFAKEALQITCLCLLITGLFKLFSASNQTLLIVFNMAVMSSAATFSVTQKNLDHILLGSLVVTLSIVLGGIFGFYAPKLTYLLTIAYAGFAFYLPSTKNKTNIFVTGAVMFLIFSAFPFDLKSGIKYLGDGLFVILIFQLTHFFLRNKGEKAKLETNENPHITSLIAISSLSAAWFINHFLIKFYSPSHLYWVALTILVVIQGSQQKIISTSIKRIAVNILGAILIVLLFSYIIPAAFWINFFVLVVFLFCIFFLGFNYVARTLFIELFVLGFTHLLGNYQNQLAFDRATLTLIGGLIVITMTLTTFILIKAFIKKVKIRQPDIETARLYGYIPDMIFFELYQRMFQDETFVECYGVKYDDEKIKSILTRDIGYWDQYHFGPFVWFDKKTHQFVGEGGLNHTLVENEPVIELTYSLMPDFWGEGFAVEIGRYAINDAFNRLGLDHLVCFTASTNHQSLRVMQKLGFQFKRDFTYQGVLHLLHQLYPT